MWVVDQGGALREVRGVESVPWRLRRAVGWYLRYGTRVAAALVFAWLVWAVFFDYGGLK